MMPLSAGEIRNALTILRSIDRHHLDEAGFAATDSDWALFRDDPASFYLRAGTAAREAITNIINRRMPAGA
jgi:hypothetical protein